MKELIKITTNNEGNIRRFNYVTLRLVLYRIYYSYNYLFSIIFWMVLRRVKMDIKLENMSYQEFKKYCSDRACDGQWSMLEAMACLNVIEEIDKIKVKGLFKKKKTIEAREIEWEKRNYKTIS